MKAVIVALFALVAVCQAGILAAPGVIGAPTALSVNAGPLGLTAPGLVAAAPWAAAPWAAAPLAAAAIPAAVAAPVAVAPAGAPYIAANRGSVHVAPLAGHLVGSKQLNLSPAPGTIW